MRQVAIGRWLPLVDVVRRYQRAWLRRDLIAGAVLTALLIPAGIGYAQVAGLPPETGLYATVIPLLVYAVLGPSRILVLGPDSSLAPIIAASILPLAAGDPDRAVALAGLLAVMMGAVLLLGSAVRLGFVTDLISKPIRIGYLNGIAIVVVIGQLPALAGFSVESSSLIGRIGDIVARIDDGAIDATALSVGLASLALIVVLGRLGLQAIGVAIVVVGAVIVTAVLGLDDQLPVVGALPTGLPAPALGGLKWSDVGSLTVPALGIALIAFADTSVLSRTFSARRGEAVDGSREMMAIGAANVGAGLLGGFAVSASSSRTPVAERAGAMTQITGVVGAGLIIAFTLLAPGLTGQLPRSALAAIVIVAAVGLFDVRNVLALARADPLEAVFSVSALIGVTLIGVLEGIAVAIGLSLLDFVNRSWRPYRTLLGRIPGVRGYHDLSRHPEAVELSGIVIVRFDAPLFFANGGIFDDFVRSAVGDRPDVHTVILAAEPITDVDSTAIDELVELDDFLISRGIRLVIAEMKGPVKDQIARYRLGDRFGPERHMPTVGAAVDAITGDFRGDITPDVTPEA